jgi:hypothetical protein
MPILIPQADYPELIDIINETYTDGLDRILAAEIDDRDNIICLAQDGDKQLAIEITDSDIKIKLYNPTAKFRQEPDTPSQIATNLQKIGDPIFGGWLEQIKQMLETSDDLESMRESLFQLYPDLDGTELTEQMTDAMALASMAGFWEAGNEGDESEFARIPDGTVRRRNGVDYVLIGSRWHSPNGEMQVDALDYSQDRTKPINPRKALAALLNTDDVKILDHLSKKYSGLHDVYRNINPELADRYIDLSALANDLRNTRKVDKAKPLDLPMAEAEISEAKSFGKLFHLADKHESLADFFAGIDEFDRADSHRGLADFARSRSPIDEYFKIESAKNNPKAKFIGEDEGQKMISTASSEAHLQHLENKFGTLANFFESDPDDRKYQQYDKLASAAMDKRLQDRSDRLDREQNYQIKPTEAGLNISVKPLSGKDEIGEWSAEAHDWSFTKFGSDWQVEKPPVGVSRVGASKEFTAGRIFKASPVAAWILNDLHSGSKQSDMDDLIGLIRKDRLNGAQFAAMQPSGGVDAAN